MKVGDKLELQIERLSFTGKGIGRNDNFVVFIPHTIPGDRVFVEIIQKKRKYADGRVIEYIQRSENLVEAECRHFGICGGCSFQNLPYQLQLDAKREAVTEHLRRIGKIDDPPVSEIVPSASTFYYRNKMEFSFVPDHSERLKLGLHHRGEWENIFNVESCLLQSELSNRIVSSVRKFFIEHNTAAYHLSEHHGYLRFLAIRESKATGEVMLILVTNNGEFKEKDEFIELIRKNFPEVTSIVQVINSKKANIAIGEKETILYGNEYIIEIIGGKKFIIRPSSFFQTNSRQTELLYKKIVELANFGHEENVLDLYTGCGTIAIHISGLVKSVLGIELNPDAVRSAHENAALNQINNCGFEAGDVRKIMNRIIENGNHRFDTIIVDPPRAGIGHKVISRIVHLYPEKIIYVSCNPSTLASDVLDLSTAGYHLDKTIPVDMFPHTFHIESVSRLSRDH